MKKFIIIISSIATFGSAFGDVKTYEGIKEVTCFGLVMLCTVNPRCEEQLSEEARNLALGSCFSAGNSQCDVVHSWKGEDCSFHAIARGQP